MATALRQIERFNVVSQPGSQPEKKQESFEAKLVSTVRNYYDLTRSSRPRRYYLWLMSALMSKGIHYVFYDPYRGSVEEWPQKKVSQCMYTPYPLIQYAVQVIASQYITSNGQAVPQSEADEDPKMKAVLRMLKDYGEYLDWEFFRRDPQARQTEANMLPLRGCYSFVHWDKNAGPKMQVPQYAPQQKMICSDCGDEAANAGIGNDGRAGPGNPVAGAQMAQGLDPQMDDGTAAPGSSGMAQGTACPQCGGKITPIVGGVDLQGMLPARQGAARRDVVDPFQVEIFDRRRGVEGSKHLVYDEILFKSEAMQDYPWLKGITGQASMGSYQQGFLGLHYLMQLQILLSNTGRLDQSQPDYIDSLGPSANTLGYYGSFLNELLCWRRRTWLDPTEIADWVFEQDTQLPGRDDIIPRGTRCIEVFPDGPCVHQMNGETVVQVENQNKNKHWSYCAYRPPTEGLHGTGVANLISLNRGYDEAASFQMQALLDAALGRVLYDERITSFKNIPGKGTAVPQDARPLNEPLENLIARVDVGGNQAIAAAEPIKESQRGMLGDLTMAANPQGRGLSPQGVGGDTATAVRYNAGATSTLQSPPMELYAAHRAKSIEQAVELERLHGIKPRGYTKQGETAKKWFDPLQIPEDVRWVVAEDSWQPRTMETKRENIGAAVGLGVGQGKLAPQVEEQAIRVFGLDEETDDYEDWAVKAEKRLDALKAAVGPMMQEAQQALAMVEDPEEAAMMQQAAPQRLIELAQAAPQPMDQPGHSAYVRFYGELYLTDDWDAYPPVLQQAVTMLWQMHQMAVQQAQMQQAAIESGVDPQVDADTKEGEEESRNAEQQRSEESESKSHKRALKTEEVGHEHKIEQEKLKHKNAKELEALRAKNRAKGARK